MTSNEEDRAQSLIDILYGIISEFEDEYDVSIDIIKGDMCIDGKCWDISN